MDKHKETQIAAISGIWLGAVILFAALFISAGLQGAFTVTHYIFAALILVMASLGTGAAIYGIRDNKDIAKAKRQRIDTMLRDMSDGDLLELKQRLAEGDYTEESLLDLVADDGELIIQG